MAGSPVASMTMCQLYPSAQNVSPPSPLLNYLRLVYHQTPFEAYSMALNTTEKLTAPYFSLASFNLLNSRLRYPAAY